VELQDKAEGGAVGWTNSVPALQGAESVFFARAEVTGGR
jgi:hypothetical protein